MSSGDLLGIVEAAYRVDGSDEDWLQGIAEASLPVLNRGRGIVATWLAKDEHAGPTFAGTPIGVGMDDRILQKLGQSMAAVPPERRARAVASSPCSTLSESLGEGERFRQDAVAREFLQPYGVFDVMWIAASDAPGSCVGLGIGLPDITRTLPRERLRYSRLGAHLTTALRLRRRLRAGAKEDGEARMSPGGAVDSVLDGVTTPGTLAALRAAAVALDRAKGPLRTSPDEALAAWTSLVSARWSLVDQFDRGGRRYIIAHANEPKTQGLPSLSERERLVVQYAALGHPNKLIAYELGLAVSTVATFLRRAMKKLGLRTRLELIARGPGA
jgi:DNA-binding CsgD family transcriptional regulator